MRAGWSAGQKHLESGSRAPPSLGPRLSIYALALAQSSRAFGLGRENVLKRHGADSWSQRSGTYRVAFVREQWSPVLSNHSDDWETKNCRVMLGPRFHEQLNMLTKSFPYNPSQRDSLNVVAQFLKILLQREICRILRMVVCLKPKVKHNLNFLAILLKPYFKSSPYCRGHCEAISLSSFEQLSPSEVRLGWFLSIGEEGSDC